jgi:undecaprenyl-diphosphatase
MDILMEEMSIFEIIISGLLQGVTEFLPISSSGHLVLLHNFFGYEEPLVLFDIFLHIGTLLAVLIYFAKDIKDMIINKRKYLGFVVLSVFPAALIGIFFENSIEKVFANSVLVGCSFLLTSALLFIAQVVTSRAVEMNKHVDTKRSVFIGFAQAIALLPGVSRSGMTVSFGMISGISPEGAFKFAFLMSIPAIVGGLVLKLTDSLSINMIAANWKGYLLGMIVSFAGGIVCLPILKEIIKRRHLYVFGIYCLFLGITVIIFL